VGGAPLRVQFPRLFDLAENKEATVREMEGRGWAVDGGAWEWRRRLSAWEEESLSECATLLSDIILQESIFDRWRWVHDLITGYSVRGAYKYLTMPVTTAGRAIPDVVWLKQVPMKVSVFDRRLLHIRLPTKYNLVRRRVLHHEDTACVGGCGGQETATHLLLGCTVFGGLWHLIYQWLGISFIPPESVADHLHHLGQLASVPLSKHTFFKVIWHATAWVIWKERNSRLFNNKIQEVVHLLEIVKFLSYSWLKVNLLTSAYSYTDWWQHPLLCMCVGEYLFSFYFAVILLATDT
jgi:hypothetical protein